MKIGILTYHSVYNFGANLQVYSTVGYLRNNGLDPIIINWIPEDFEVRNNRSISTIQAEAHDVFISKRLPCTDICRTDSDIINVIRQENIKGIVIGSDAVLRHKPFLSRFEISKKGIILSRKPGIEALFPNPFWGSFIPLLGYKIPMIIMSASSQNTDYKYIRGKLRSRIKKSLSQFDSISVRDNWTRRMVKYLTSENVTPLITPDPVFAYNQNITKQFTKNEILQKFSIERNYFLISFRTQNVVSKNWLSYFQDCAEKINYQCIALTMPGGIHFDHPFSKEIRAPLSPEEWYSLIKFSGGYIGENMHPIVVALHNSVPFYSFDSYGIVRYKYYVHEKSSKIYDILSYAGFLKNRISILRRGYKIPPPGEVFLRIKDFDFEKCQKFSNSQLARYNDMMANNLHIFLGN